MQVTTLNHICRVSRAGSRWPAVPKTMHRDLPMLLCDRVFATPAGGWIAKIHSGRAWHLCLLGRRLFGRGGGRVLGCRLLGFRCGRWWGKLRELWHFPGQLMQLIY